MTTEGSEALLLEYAKNPPNKGKISNYTIEHHESNRSCGDSLTVYLRIDNADRVVDFSFDGDTAIVTTAVAAIFGEAIIGLHIDEIANYTYESVQEMIQIKVSPKRKLAASLALLATRNALHKLRRDGIVDDFSDVLE